MRLDEQQREAIRLGFGAEVAGEYQPLCRNCGQPVAPADCEWTGHTAGLVYVHKQCRTGSPSERRKATVATFFAEEWGDGQ